MPKISIIIPTYNSSLFLKRTVKSVLSQTFTDWELLMVDDCSTDNTAELIEEFTKQDSRIKLYKTPQNSGGPATAKNIGINNAQGEYVAFLDHDDEWLPEKLKKQLELFETSKNEKLGLVSCYINIRDNNTKKIISKHRTLYKENTLSMLLQYNFLVTSSCVMTKLEILKKVGLFDTDFKVSDDWDMWLRIIKSRYELDFIPECLVDYFVHENNLSSNKEREVEEFKLLFNKNNEGPFRIKESWFLSYYYFNKGQYKLSRKYYIQNLNSSELSFLVRIKSLAYIFLTFFPGMEETFKKIWWKIK
jgi:glycosyltransferase involved in cell wall biosynthesis